MNDKVKTAETKGDVAKWLIVLVLVVAGVYGNSHFSDYSWVYRSIALVVLAAVAAFIAGQTAKGRAFVELGVEAKTEIRKVVWPTREETTHTTLIVVAAVLVLALILYALDSTLSWLLKTLLGV
ncbi:MAG TPA: preprotein translocase subunit SecE [Candidatus Acidoferrum sp.]|nr:preprotein translocase subunit SecE [Candidatus Acidoferrum sp.]